mmetsp:Transcript_3669/g.8068  ORF Transcript_3669/g.8068 Transcript_3669/m.8068 type:complete len:94 (+) Transcript_3669:46-327(+)
MQPHAENIASDVHLHRMKGCDVSEKEGASATVQFWSTTREPASEDKTTQWWSDLQLRKSSAHEYVFKPLEDFSFNLIDAWNLGDLIDDLKFAR